MTESIIQPDHSYGFLILGGSGSGKTNVLLNVTKNWLPDINNIYLYAKDLFEYKVLIVY